LGIFFGSRMSLSCSVALGGGGRWDLVDFRLLVGRLFRQNPPPGIDTDSLACKADELCKNGVDWKTAVPCSVDGAVKEDVSTDRLERIATNKSADGAAVL
jgi:hypothetical protein